MLQQVCRDSRGALQLCEPHIIIDAGCDCSSVLRAMDESKRTGVNNSAVSTFGRFLNVSSAYTVEMA